MALPKSQPGQSPPISFLVICRLYRIASHRAQHYKVLFALWHTTDGYTISVFTSVFTDCVHTQTARVGCSTFVAASSSSNVRHNMPSAAALVQRCPCRCFPRIYIYIYVRYVMSMLSLCCINHIMMFVGDILHVNTGKSYANKNEGASTRI